VSISEYRTNGTRNQAIKAPNKTMVTAMTTGPVIGSLCTGYGGLDLGVLAALGGGRIAWCADPDPHIATILTTRMPDVPNLGDLRTVDWSQVEPQDISAAGRRAGIEKGERSGLWTDIMAALRLLRPTLLVVENVAALRWRHGGLHRVLADLADAGYDAIWRSLRAADIGAAHRRERLFLLSWPQHSSGDATDSPSPRWSTRNQRLTNGTPGRWTSSQPSRRRHLLPTTAGIHHSHDGDRDDGTAASHPERFGCEGLPATDTSQWTLPARRSSAATHAGSLARGNSGSPGRGRSPTALTTTDASDCGPRGAVADTASHRRHEGRRRATGLQGRPHAPLGDHSPTIPTGQERHLLVVEDRHENESATAGPGERGVDWGISAAAVTRWERVLGRPAPAPTQVGRRGGPVLSAVFVEHLMGLPRGWMTDLPLPRTAQLRALGNGVVPQQAAYAVSLLLADLATLTAAERPDSGQELNAA
jgi:DNA (cytosine-5)-methyltransferase 1